MQETDFETVTKSPLQMTETDLQGVNSHHCQTVTDWTGCSFNRR